MQPPGHHVPAPGDFRNAMRNRPFSFVFLGAVATALVAQFGREVFSIVSQPVDFREGPWWHFRESALGQALPYGLLCLLVPFVRLPAASRWFLMLGFLVVAYIGVFDLGGLYLGGGESGFAAFLCLRMQIWVACGAGLLALASKALQNLSERNVPRS
jgi:hypothetical protein